MICVSCLSLMQSEQKPSVELGWELGPTLSWVFLWMCDGAQGRRLFHRDNRNDNTR